MRTDAAALSAALAGRVHELVRELLPAGRRDGQEWRCGSVAGERGQSLAVHLSGARAGVWSDFSGGSSGDALDLVAAVLFAGDRGQAMRWSRGWLGLQDVDPGLQPRRPVVVPDTGRAETDAEAEERRRAAMRIWLGCKPGLRGTPVDHYLSARGIALAELGRAPGAVRFHPELWNTESRRSWPAMVAAISGPSGSMLAIHRTWLATGSDGAWAKAPLNNPKMTLGRYAGGTIRLARGSTRKPLAQAPEGERVILAEGIETGLSVALACPELRVLAAISLSNMGRVELPATVREIVIAGDNDDGNETAQKALQAAIDRFLEQGRTVRIAIPSIAGADWNDVLRDQAA
ncbi:toprim domain-containing protein [Acetobacteraceae bacterium KSS8]|uniref:Toprim domain-containing protein n=1 Tax=Endosaccharibacter trunci TaxID=2812733 RepID=A0ABT1WAK4_9PROT|nr:toprim domain-containing protein [Acetobacteraceae bacterium KSS8]